MTGLRSFGALPSLTYMFQFNLSIGWVENRWSSTFTPLHVSIENFITWLHREYVELFLHSPTCVHSTFHLAGLRIGGALPSPPYMCPFKLLSRGWVENSWSSTFTSLHVSIEILITWLGWEYVETYLHYPTCVHWNFYKVAVLRIGGLLP